MTAKYTEAQPAKAYTDSTDLEEPYLTSPRSAASATSDVQLVPAAAASSSSGNQQGSSSAASPLSSGGSKRQFWTRRRRIFCFVCLGLIFVVAAVMIPVLIYVILPNIVQGNLNNSRFDFTGANFTQLSNSTVGFNLDMNIGNAGALPMDISFFSDLNVQYNGKDVLTVPKPQKSCKVSGGTCPIQEPFVATIKDQEGWKQFNQDLVLNKDFTWFISADVRVVVFNPITVAASMTKRPLGAKAFSNFNQGTDSPLTPQIRSIDFPGPNLSPFTGLNITLTTFINNPSSIEMPYGPAVLDLYLAPSTLDPVTTLIGKVFTDAFVVKPGDNSIPFRGAILPIDPTKNDVQIRVSRLFDAFLQSRDTQMYLAGTSQGSIDKPDDRVAYLENAIKNINLTAIFNGTDDQTLINTITVGSNSTLDLTVANGTGNGATLSAGPVEGQFSIPFDFRYSLRTFTYDMELEYNGNKVGAISTPAIATSGTSGSRGERRPFNSTFDNLSIRSENSSYISNFRRYIADLTTSSEVVAATFIGAADIGLNTEIGLINVTKLPIPRGSGNVGQLALRGLNGFRTNPRIVALDLIAGDPSALTFNLTLALTNPSTVSINYGDLNFYFNYTFAGASVNLGRVAVPRVNLARSSETLFASATVTYSPPALPGAGDATPASNDFLSKYINSGAIAGTLSSIINETSTNPTVDYALQNITLVDLPITTRNASLFPTTTVGLNLETLFTGTTNFRLGQANPFGTTLAWTEMRGNVTWTDNGVAYNLGSFDTGAAAGNFSTAAVAPGGSGSTDVVATLNLQNANGPFFIKYALEATRATSAPVRFSTTARVAIGGGGIAGGSQGFTADLVYAQDARGSVVPA